MYNNTANYKTEINIKYGELTNVVSWCKTNIEGQWAFEESQYNLAAGSWNFYFENEKDLVKFLLWKK